MGIEISISLPGILDLSHGTLDAKQVFAQYHTQHDSRVRPSHAALAGKVFRIDDVMAPVPPIDYGCRCFLTYVAKAQSPATRILPEAPAAPTTVAQAYTEHLDKIAPRWPGVHAEMMKAPPASRLSVAFLLLRKLMPDRPADDLRDLARMILQAEVASGP